MTRCICDRCKKKNKRMEEFEFPFKLNEHDIVKLDLCEYCRKLLYRLFQLFVNGDDRLHNVSSEFFLQRENEMKLIKGHMLTNFVNKILGIFNLRIDRVLCQYNTAKSWEYKYFWNRVK